MCFLQDIEYVVRCAIWYHLYNLKNLKNTHWGVLILVKLQASACNFNKINTPQCVFFAFFKLYKWHQIAQRITYVDFVFSYFSERFWSFGGNISSFCVCHHCYRHCVLQCVPLLKIKFDILSVIELLIYSKKYSLI